MTFTELYDVWWKDKPLEIRTSTASLYTTHWLSVKKIIGDMDVESFDTHKAQRLLNKMIENGLGAKSAHDRIAVVKMMLVFALQNLSIPVKPLDWKLRYPATKRRLLKCFRRDEAKKIIRCVYKEISVGKTSTFPAALSLLTGLRLGEVCGLRWEDFDFPHKTFVVQRKIISFHDPVECHIKTIIGPPKTSAGYREVPVAPVLMKLLRLAYGDITKRKGFVVGDGEEPRGVRTVRDSYDRFLKRHKLPDINFHGLRHTFATILIESGIDVKTVSDIIGHADVSTTFNLYVHPSADAKKKAVLKAFRGFNLEE